MHSVTKWQQPQRRRIPAKLYPWLTDKGSLTRRLQQHNKVDFTVQLLGNSWIKPLVDECRYLAIPISELSYQREVRLMDGDIANVYARTIVPRTTYLSMPYRFNNLGTKPLGEMLFNDPTVTRGPIEVACLKPGQWLYEMALLAENDRPDKLWARRSHFYLQGNILLVNEIFLPALER